MAMTGIARTLAIVTDTGSEFDYEATLYEDERNTNA
jgi:hypothetical protein